jgi:hypothetical protein
MPTFPTLKTGAVTQYPLAVEQRFRTESVTFLDGSSHRYSTAGPQRRVWSVKLAGLDAAESLAVREFIRRYGAGVFAFPDPATGEVVPRCIVAGSEITNSIEGELAEALFFAVEELP